MPRKQLKLWGLISRKPRWGLTIRGWLGILLAIVLLFCLALFKLEAFFSYSAPVEAQVLVVESWIGDIPLQGAIAEFQRQPYRLLVTAGSDLRRGQLLSQYKDYAHLSEATLIELGFDPEKIQAIRTPIVDRDRTLNSALAVKKWLKQNEIGLSGINVYSEDVHGRRSWLIYRKVFEPEIQVGVISHPAISYDPKRWWTSSEGFKRTIGECISYLYTLSL